jgi:hypothetical protein
MRERVQDVLLLHDFPFARRMQLEPLYIRQRQDSLLESRQEDQRKSLLLERQFHHLESTASYAVFFLE